MLYTQDNLPPDVKSKDAYKRRQRKLRAANVPGVWVRGKLLCCTASAWGTDLQRANPVAQTAAAPGDRRRDRPQARHPCPEGRYAMSTDTDAAERLLAARTTQTTDRQMRIIYAAEARILIARERERLRQQALLLDQIEAEIVRTSTPEIANP